MKVTLKKTELQYTMHAEYEKSWSMSLHSI